MPAEKLFSAVEFQTSFRIQKIRSFREQIIMVTEYEGRNEFMILSDAGPLSLGYHGHAIDTPSAKNQLMKKTVPLGLINIRKL